MSLNGERLHVAIYSIVWQGRVFTVNLTVDDEDGLSGMYIPGAPVSDAMRESAGQNVGMLAPAVVGTNLAGEAAGVGVSLARSLIGKKVRMIRVTVPAGHHVLLHVKNVGL